MFVRNIFVAIKGCKFFFKTICKILLKEWCGSFNMYIIKSASEFYNTLGKLYFRLCATHL